MSGPQRIVFLAPPGGGKSTQARRVAEALGVPHIATGDLLRAEIEAGTDLGRLVEPHVVAGDLVPDDLVVRVLRGRVDGGGFVLDGFPRDRAQAALLDRHLEALDHVIVLRVPVEDIVARLDARRGRPDDAPEVVRKRLEVYDAATAPLIDHYRGRGIVREIDGTGTVDEVTARVLGAVAA